MTAPTNAPLELDDSAETAVEWFQKHSRQVGIAVLGVAAVAVVTWLVRASNEKKEFNASRALADAQRSVATANLPLAAADLQKLTDRYGSTRAGLEAKVLLAQVLLQQGKTADAIKLLQGVSGAGPMTASVHALTGAALEQEKKYLESAAAYLKAADATSFKSEKESYRADAARAYVKGGKSADALKIWQAMADDPTSTLSGEAQLRVGELTAKPAK